MSGAPKLLLYGDVDLNIIDGSAIWLTSVAEMLARHGPADITVLLKAPESRTLLTGPLRNVPRVQLHEPSIGRRLRPRDAVEAIMKLDREMDYDAIILRGYEVSKQAASRLELRGRLWPYLTDIPQRPEEVSAGDRDNLARIAAASEVLLCQTEQLRDHLEGLLPPDERRTALLTPMVPEEFRPSDAARDPDGHAIRRVLYAGKFAPLWGVLELAQAVQRLQADVSGLQLHLAGDKVHDPADAPSFAPSIRRLLEAPPGVVWHGAVSRSEIARLLREVDLASSVRDRGMDDSLELSTKVLEYGAAGVPVLLNRTAMHVELLGADYPLFADGLEDLDRALRLAVLEPDRTQIAAERVQAAAAAYRPDRVIEPLRPFLKRLRPVSRTTRRPRVVVAGHDLKFVEPYLRWLHHSGAEVRLDRWTGHERHDEGHSERMLEWADTILAEWCLGNAVWYARHRRSDQRLVVRFHRQELETPFPEQLGSLGVDRVVTVSDRIAQTVRERYDWSPGLVRTVPNSVDTVALDRRKLPHAPRTLGLLGALPRLKRLDRALDLLELLLDHDPRWRLRVAGTLPFESSWVWARLEERAWFSAQLDRIRRSPRLRQQVSFDGRVHPATWLRTVGVILSPSNQESFHLALAEGMASRAVPAIWDREGASEIFSPQWVYPDTQRAAEEVADSTAGAGQRARDEIAEHYALDRIGPQLVAEVLG